MSLLLSFCLAFCFHTCPLGLSGSLRCCCPLTLRFPCRSTRLSLGLLFFSLSLSYPTSIFPGSSLRLSFLSSYFRLTLLSSLFCRSLLAFCLSTSLSGLSPQLSSCQSAHSGLHLSYAVVLVCSEWFSAVSGESLPRSVALPAYLLMLSFPARLV